MDIEEQDDNNSGGTSDEEFLDRVAAKYEKADRKAGINQSDDEDAEDDPESDEDPEDEGAEEDDDSDDEHPEADTDEDSDEESDPTDADSDEDDDADTDDDPSDEDDPDAESDDDADADDEDPDAEEDDDEDPVSAGSRAALEEHGADLKLDDIKDKSVRALVEKKLKSVDAAFTRSVQKKHRELVERYGVEERYRRDNLDLYIVEAIQKDPTILDRVNKHLTKIDPAEEGNDEESIKDAKSLLDERIKNKRDAAKKALDAEFAEYDNRVKRTDEMESYVRKAATKKGLPMTRSLEKAIAAAIVLKPEDQRLKGLSNEEIDEIVGEFAVDHLRSVRAHRREASKKAILERQKGKAAPKPTIRPPKGATRPGVSKPKAEVVDHNDEESRHRAMMRSARRIKPGARDK